MCGKMKGGKNRNEAVFGASKYTGREAWKTLALKTCKMGKIFRFRALLYMPAFLGMPKTKIPCKLSAILSPV